MKKSNLKIMGMLQAFDSKDVLSAFELFKKDMNNPNTFDGTEEELINEGWVPANGNVRGKETFYFNDIIWVQSEEIQQKQSKELIKKAAQKNPRVKKQSMSLNATNLSCPRCKGMLHKQNICNGCKEGKQGFKIRLICEENPDHEILL